MKLLIISGPTATGKTALAVNLAKKFNGELVSADSRQIYQGMDIGTGKDHPNDIPVHQINLITPDQSYSVAQYRQSALKAITAIHDRGKLPIVVGGTGQYIDSILHFQATYNLKPIPILRFLLNRLSLQNLQRIYSFLDSSSFAALNNSEKHNPHRLIRKIEIKISLPQKITATPALDFNTLHLSLTAPNEVLYKRIDYRVDERLKKGLLKEISNLLKVYRWTDPGFNTLAYREFKDYFSNKKTLEEVTQIWKYDEHAYARRQKTYLKKMGSKNLDITNPEFGKLAFDIVKKWYN